jgi:nucleotide-binding universal stress UspA family protein
MTLLVGFAPGEDDISGLELAGMLARSTHDDLVVVSVVPAPWPTPVAGDTDRDFKAWAASYGDAAVTEAEGVLAEVCPDVTARATWSHGRSVPTTLMEQAGQLGARMIVVGSSRDGGYGRANIGTIGDRLLHSSPIPVAVATRGFRAAHGRVGRATCAFRGDEVSRSTLERTATICADIGAALRIATFAVRGRTMYPPETGIHAEDMVLEQWVIQATKAQAEAIDSLRERGGLPESVEAVVGSGRSWEAAVDELPWERDDVLVIGSSAAGLVERIFLGSAASKIVRHSPVPVIVVR